MKVKSARARPRVRIVYPFPAADTFYIRDTFETSLPRGAFLFCSDDASAEVSIHEEGDLESEQTRSVNAMRPMCHQSSSTSVTCVF
jgi:hypothetical protein